MTQALALARFLRSAGHDVTRVLVGESPHRTVPEYFAKQIDAPLETFDAPTLVPDRHGRGASRTATFRDVCRRGPAFVGSIGRIRRAARHADVVVNFLDLMGGLARLYPGVHTPSVAIAHNYVFLHDALAAAPGPRHVRGLVMAYVRATAIGSGLRVALSFGTLPRESTERLSIAPPLLRPGLKDLPVSDGGYLLAYALNPGYGASLARWHRRHPGVRVHCYLDGGSAALPEAPEDGFVAHELSEQGFLRHLAGCRAYVGSAGFESICEAFYLGKPVLAVPTAGHYEQTLNAWDAERVGAARAGSYDDLDDFWEAPPVPSAASVRHFRDWVADAPKRIVGLIERAASPAR